MDSKVDISIVVSVAAVLVLAALILSFTALRRNADADARGGMAWLFAANLAFLLGTGALLFAGWLPFWLSAGLVILGAHLGILCGYAALSRALGHPPPVVPLAALATLAVGAQAGIAAATGDVAPLLATSSLVNGTLGAVLGWRIWPHARTLGREAALLAALPFAAISVSYLVRLPLLAFWPEPAALAVATVLITFLLAFSALQWCFALIAYRTVRLNRWLEAERLRAEEASRLKSQFLTNMSHEIRTPLNGVLGMAQALQSEPATPRQRELVETIQHSGETLLGILNDILDLSKIEAGRMEIDPAPFRPSELIARIARLYRLRAEDKGLAFDLDQGPGLDRLRLGDAQRIAQVLNNLLGNSVKFTESGTIHLRAALAPPEGPRGLPSREDGRDGAASCPPSSARPMPCSAGVPASAGAPACLHVVVEDTGIGMTPEQTARIFDEFVQADADITRRFGGTGLGMSIARRLVGLMDGELALESAAGRGTRVTLRLPLAPVPDGALAQTEPDRALAAAGADLAPAPAGPGGALATTGPGGSLAAPVPDRPAQAARLSGLRLLLAEDNRTNQRVVQAFLKDSGAELRIVGNGREAVEAVRAVEARGEPDFDLLMFDVCMPELDGPAALRAIRARRAAAGRPAPPAIALTANVMAHQLADYAEAGFCDHLAKPLRKPALLAMIAARAVPGRGTPVPSPSAGPPAMRPPPPHPSAA